MSEIICEIIGEKLIGGQEYLECHCPDENESYSVLKSDLSRYNIDYVEKHVFFKFNRLCSGNLSLFYLRPESSNRNYHSNSIYTIRDRYLFKIVSFDRGLNRKSEEINLINVEDLNNKKVSVLGLKWQNEVIWNYDYLICEVENIQQNGALRLINKDFRHPLFEIGLDYEFQVVDSKLKVTNNGSFDVFVLKGIDNCLHEVNMLPGQKLIGAKLDSIQCKIVNITTHLRLLQTGIKDPFFVTFDQIEADRELFMKYFSILFSENYVAEKHVIQLKDQYNSKEAFWVFTYANKILKGFLRRNIECFDYKGAIEVNHLILKFEDWILTKGIISSFPDGYNKHNTRFKAQHALEKAKDVEIVLNILLNNPFYFFKEISYTEQDERFLDKIFYLLSYSNFEIIEADDFLVCINDYFIDLSGKIPGDSEFWRKVVNLINTKKRIFISDNEGEIFSLSTNNYVFSDFNLSEQKYLAWSYIELFISEKIGFNEHVNITIGQMLKLFIKCFQDIEKREIVLFKAYYYLDNYQLGQLKNPFIFNKVVELNWDILGETDVNSLHLDSWKQIEGFFFKKTTFNVKLSRKSNAGYEVVFNELKGFLPMHHVKNNILKTNSFEDSIYFIEAECIAISSAFKVFIIEQTENINILDQNGDLLIPKVDEIYDATVKKVVDYGIFLYTKFGEGLLHIKEIFDFTWDENKIESYFKIGQKIKIVFKEFNQKGQLSFSFRLLMKLDLSYYETYVKNCTNQSDFDLDENDSIFDQPSYFDRTISEKAFCIEQFVVLQFDLDLKLNNLKIAKQFYSNASHARSYLLNIYISYFDILQRINLILQGDSIDGIRVIREEALLTKSKINLKTIETFPDAEKLIFFLDILCLFNEKDEDSLILLFDYIKKYSRDAQHKDLRTIAKISLANNLLVSESKEDRDYVLKNLRLINDYIYKGILSLEETVEDKNARELKEQILYWKQRIAEDESENLEFKSSLFTPIPDAKKESRIKYLSKKEIRTEKETHELSCLNGVETQKILIHSVLKTLVAFANSNGGVLLIGVDNEKNIVGIETEFNSKSPKLRYPNRDGYGLYFDDLIGNYIGDSFSSLMSRKFLKFAEGDVLIVNVAQSPNEVFLLRDENGKEKEQLFIRNLSSSRELTGTELVKFIKQKQF